MLVRRLTAGDSAAHEKLAALAFILKTDPENSALPSDFMLGAFENGVLISDMEIQERQNFYCGTTLSCLAVGGVATRPEYRNRGTVRAIFENLFSESTADISILYPFSASYYKKFGYEPCGKYLEITVPFPEFQKIQKTGSVMFFEGENADELLGLYNSYARENELCFMRENTDSFEASPYKTACYTCIYKNSEGTADAFATFTADRENRVINVKETGYTDIDGLKGILGFLRSYEGNFDTVHFEKLPFDTPVTGLINDICRCDMKFGYCGAVRVLNVTNVLKKHKYPVLPGEFTVGLKDSLPRNNGVFKVSYKNGTADISLCSAAEPDIILNCNAFSKILISGISEKELKYMNGVSVSGNCSDFIRAFPEKNIFFNDSF